MAPSLPWAILWCLNLCIICHLAFYPCGSKKHTASSVLSAPQFFHYNNSGKLTGSHNVAWLLRTPTVDFALLFSLPVSALQNVSISPCPSLCLFVLFSIKLSLLSPSRLPFLSSLFLSVPTLYSSLWNSLNEEPKLFQQITQFFKDFLKQHCFSWFVFVLSIRWLLWSYNIKKYIVKGVTGTLTLKGKLSNLVLWKLPHQPTLTHLCKMIFGISLPLSVFDFSFFIIITVEKICIHSCVLLCLLEQLKCVTHTYSYV